MLSTVDKTINYLILFVIHPTNNHKVWHENYLYFMNSSISDNMLKVFQDLRIYLDQRANNHRVIPASDI